jgi:hypothetical protein
MTTFITLKKNILILTTIIFFLLVNTTYYWEAKLGLFALPVFLLLVLVYIGLGVALVRQIYFLIKDKFADKKRFFNIGLLITVLVLTFYKPLGIIDFDKLEGVDVLIAEREGAANCLTILKLKEDHTFRERASCFGISVIKGTYTVINDTIYFENIQYGRNKNEFYEFAVIKPSEFTNSKIVADLIKYKNKADTTGYILWVTKNELNKLKDKKPNR